MLVKPSELRRIAEIQEQVAPLYERLVQRPDSWGRPINRGLLEASLERSDILGAQPVYKNIVDLEGWQAVWIDGGFFSCSTNAFQPIRHRAVVHIALTLLWEIMEQKELHEVEFDYLEGTAKRSEMSAWITFPAAESVDWQIGVVVQNAYHSRKKPTLEVFYRRQGKIRITVPDLETAIGIERSGQLAVHPSIFGFSDEEAVLHFYKAVENLPKLIDNARSFRSALNATDSLGVPSKHMEALVVEALGLKTPAKFKRNAGGPEEADDLFAEVIPETEERGTLKRGGMTAAGRVMQVVRAELSGQNSVLVSDLLTVATEVSTRLDKEVSGLGFASRASALGRLVSKLSKHLEAQRAQGRSGADWDSFLAPTRKSWGPNLNR
jgi:hypothetical protein